MFFLNTYKKDDGRVERFNRIVNLACDSKFIYFPMNASNSYLFEL